MRVVVITPPDPVVTWDDADAHIGLSGDTSQEPHVESLIDAATAHIDGPDGWLGRALGLQTLEAQLGAFDDLIRLPYPPHVAITSVKYIDPNGVEQTAVSSSYELFAGELMPAYGTVWPATRWGRGSVRVRYTAGYENEIPAPIRSAILLMVGDLFRFRETVTEKIMSSLSPYRIYA